MYEVHKFMALDSNEVGYFIEQVGLSAKSFGVAEEDGKVAVLVGTQRLGQIVSPRQINEEEDPHVVGTKSRV